MDFYFDGINVTEIMITYIKHTIKSHFYENRVSFKIICLESNLDSVVILSSRTHFLIIGNYQWLLSDNCDKVTRRSKHLPCTLYDSWARYYITCRHLHYMTAIENANIKRISKHEGFNLLVISYKHTKFISWFGSRFIKEFRTKAIPMILWCFYNQ